MEGSGLGRAEAGDDRRRPAPRIESRPFGHAGIRSHTGHVPRGICRRRPVRESPACVVTRTATVPSGARSKGRTMTLIDVEQHQEPGSDDDIQQQSDGAVGIALVRRRVLRQRWQHPKQDRHERDREADRDGDRRPPRSLIGHRPQRPEQGRTQDEGEAEAEPGVGKMLAISPRRATRLEETDLPEQRTREPARSRSRIGSTERARPRPDQYGRLVCTPISEIDRPFSRDDVVVILVMTRAGEDGCENVIETRRIVEMSGGPVVGSGQASS